ncbi:MAG: diguanylate cyclase, partial [Gammaproteobacteria bacterium]
MAATTSALLFAVIMAVRSEYITSRDSVMESLLIQARMVASNTTAALVFNDAKTAEEVLQAFSESSDVQSASIYSADGNMLARYIKHGLAEDVTEPDQFATDDSTRLQKSRTQTHDSGFLIQNKIDIAHDIDLDNELIGRLFIRADISHLIDDVMQYIYYTSMMALIGLGLASLLLLKLKSSITLPLKKLTDVMDTVIHNDDYSIRAEANDIDEIGALAKYFNKMLTHIQVNDEKLAYELSERYKAEKHLDKLAYYDVITDLPNRHFFHDHLNAAVDRSIESGRTLVLLFLDLDDFKVVNDTLGHKMGDLLLKQVSARLSNVLRKDDYICRVGGDEFAIVLEDVAGISIVSSIAEKCIKALSNPFVFEDRKFYIGVSIGISVCPDDAVNANILLVNADMAMYEAKLHGKNNYQFFSREINDVYSRKYQLQSDLRLAIKRNELELFYQPQVCANNASLVGVEALMRWNHPEMGMISPEEFIPIAEETGLIQPIGQWLIQSACRHGKQLVNAGLSEFTVAINISGLQIRDDGFTNEVSLALQRAGLEPRYLELELTESTLMHDGEFVVDNLSRLQNLGVHIAIDDFGTGYSSMSYLK